MHIPPGINFYPHDAASNPIQQFWDQGEALRYLKLVKKYEEHIFFNLASHIHRGKFMAPISNQVKDLELTIIITPAVSPVYDNNPGYSVLDIEWKDQLVTGKAGFEFQEVTFHFYDLLYYTIFKGEKWNSVPVMSGFGVDLNSVESIR
jgi:hypothetical protein